MTLDILLIEGERKAREYKPTRESLRHTPAAAIEKQRQTRRSAKLTATEAVAASISASSASDEFSSMEDSDFTVYLFVPQKASRRLHFGGSLVTHEDISNESARLPRFYEQICSVEPDEESDDDIDSDSSSEGDWLSWNDEFKRNIYFGTIPICRPAVWLE